METKRVVPLFSSDQCRYRFLINTFIAYSFPQCSQEKFFSCLWVWTVLTREKTQLNWGTLPYVKNVRSNKLRPILLFKKTRFIVLQILGNSASLVNIFIMCYRFNTSEAKGILNWVRYRTANGIFWNKKMSSFLLILTNQEKSWKIQNIYNY